MTDSIRLAKRIAEMRACSRREAELIIVGGWVKVDGVVIEEPQFRVADQRIDIDPAAVSEQAEPVTLLLHKPAGIAAATLLPGYANQWSEDASGLQPLKMHFSRLTACAPLDDFAGGLLVLTQDWRIARKLTEDAATVEHEFVIEVAGDLAASQTPEGIKRLNRGASPTSSSSLKISWQNETRLRVAFKGGRIAPIVQACESAGLHIVAIKRIRLGGVAMGKLPAGLWRYLRGSERF
jgi:23S rRNA pseudouridine2604 synthase